MKNFMKLLTDYEEVIAKARELEGRPTGHGLGKPIDLKELYANKQKMLVAREKLIEHVCFLQTDIQEAAVEACKNFEPQGPQEWVEGFKAAQVVIRTKMDRLNDQ